MKQQKVSTGRMAMARDQHRTMVVSSRKWMFRQTGMRMTRMVSLNTIHYSSLPSLCTDSPAFHLGKTTPNLVRVLGPQLLLRRHPLDAASTFRALSNSPAGSRTGKAWMVRMSIVMVSYTLSGPTRDDPRPRASPGRCISLRTRNGMYLCAGTSPHVR